ncbi:MAG: 50S ribosomal protein L18 [Firmicutes bacterium]|jgi:large subunit ribosomal protein L18|nr:50S ribosomal protein L18 [Bacillota bacterium]
MIKMISRNENRKRRHWRVRKKVHGTGERPRLNVFRSNRHIYAQIIDDVDGHTLAAASSLDPALRASLSSGGNREAARKVGELIAERALDRGITKVIFDRGGYLYHGRVRELADAAREKGLIF